MKTIEDHITLIESELNCARKGLEQNREGVVYLHLERAKNEIKRTLEDLRYKRNG